MTDREWDRHLRIRTIGREDESSADYSPYEPTPYSVLERLAESGLIRRRDRLLDYGCGKGRVAFFMADAVGCRATGIDYSKKLINIARENRRTARTGDRVQLIHGLAEQYDIKDENAFFFFNPFSERVFEGVLRRLAASWYDNPRALTLYCYFPSDAYMRCLEDAPEIRPLQVIDCRDLFNGKEPRERVEVWRFPEQA